MILRSVTVLMSYIWSLRSDAIFDETNNQRNDHD